MLNMNGAGNLDRDLADLVTVSHISQSLMIVKALHQVVEYATIVTDAARVSPTTLGKAWQPLVPGEAARSERDGHSAIR